MKRTVELGGRTVEYELERKHVKNLNLRVRPDGSIYVSAGRAVPVREIDAFLKSRQGAILKALDRMGQRQADSPWPAGYVRGETLPFLGQRLTLEVIRGDRNCAFSDGERLTLCVKDPEDAELRRSAAWNWLRERSLEYFTGVCGKVWPLFRAYGVTYPRIRVRKMTSRWGSCQTVKKILTFNVALIAAPPECIEYVVVHEFVHFLQPDHSAAFYGYMDRFMPDWKERRTALNRLPAAD